MLRFTLATSTFQIQTTDAKGSFTPAPIQTQMGATWNYPRFVPMNNIRTPFKFTVSPTLAQAFVYDWKKEGYVLIQSKVIALEAKKYIVFNSIFPYNNPKDGITCWLWHFDNFAFDAPANATPDNVAYDYKTARTNGYELMGAGSLFNIKIPDDVGFSDPTGWQYRLYLTVTVMPSQYLGGKFPATQASTIFVNGRAFPLPLSILPDNDQRSLRIDIPAGVLVQGDNIITGSFKPNGAALENIHIECEAPAGVTLPSYSTHCSIYQVAECAPPTNPVLGADVTFTQVGPMAIWQYFQTNPPKPIVVSGKINITSQLQQGSVETGNGFSAPVDQMFFQVDTVTLLTVPLNATTNTLEGSYKFILDTTQLTNGVHEVFLWAKTPAGVHSNARYFEGGIANGYKPILIDVQNP